jgi:uncharacterized repeat protein (TIGR01451 family)
MTAIARASALRALVLLWALVLPAAAGAAPNATDQSFRGATAPNWTTGADAFLTASGGSPLDAPGSGWLRLTSPVNDQRGWAISNDAFSSSNGFAARFTQVAWGGTADPADGTSFFLVDGSQPSPTAGARGGGLGYAQTCLEPGASGGYVGIGIDEYGNFATSNECRQGPNTTLRPNSITLRGGSVDNYRVVTTVNHPGPITTANRLGAREVLLWVTSAGRATVRVRNAGGMWATVISDVDIGRTPPATLKAGFGASTGGLNNNHEVRDFTAGSPTDFVTTVTDGATEITAGGTRSYTVTVRNAGPQRVEGARVQATTTPGLTQESWTRVGGSGAGAGALDTTVDLDAGATATYTVVARAASRPRRTPTPCAPPRSRRRLRPPPRPHRRRRRSPRRPRRPRSRRRSPAARTPSSTGR